MFNHSFFYLFSKKPEAIKFRMKLIIHVFLIVGLLCEREYWDIPQQDYKIQLNKKTPSSPKTCSNCLMTFSRRMDLQYHLKWECGRTLKCQNCGRLFVRKRNLNQHLKKCLKLLTYEDEN